MAETVLVVDDDRAVRDLCLRILQIAGFQVLEAESGSCARRILNSPHNISLVVIDVVMPELSGPEALEGVLPQQNGLKVLYMSGETRENPLLQRHLQVWGCGFLAKPFLPDELICRARDLLDGPLRARAAQRAPADLCGFRLRRHPVATGEYRAEVRRLQQIRTERAHVCGQLQILLQWSAELASQANRITTAADWTSLFVEQP